MVMDPQLRGYYGSMNGSQLNNKNIPVSSNQNLTYRIKLRGQIFNQNSMDVPCSPPDPRPSDLAPSSGMNPVEDSHEDCDFSDVVLNYISQMLMEEDTEEKNCMFHESVALQAAEKSFYEAIGEKYPPLADNQPTTYVYQNHESPDKNYCGNNSDFNSKSSTSSSSIGDPGWICDFGESNVASQSASLSSMSPKSGRYVTDGFVDSLVRTLGIPDDPDTLSESDPMVQFRRGVEEASKFLPNGGSPFIDLENNRFFPQEPREKSEDAVVKVEKEHEDENFAVGSRGKKKPYPDEVDLEEGRSNKQSAVYSETNLSSEMFDLVLLCEGDKSESDLRRTLQNKGSKNVQHNGQSKGSNRGKSRGKKQGGKKDLVDLRTLLTLCAQAVVASDSRNANELLKQIRQHSSLTGDGMQRMAHYFANGLEARMAGSGTEIYRACIIRPTLGADILKAYHLFLSVCPFKKLSNFFSNKTIMQVTEKATRLHIVDFGILYGFQWPSFIQRLSSRPGGPPKLRITGIGVPQPGFRPTQVIEETGRRLANYAETFNVPFEFNAIAQKWETIQVEDLKIHDDEVLLVNCLCKFRYLFDETMMLESPRNVVLNLIRKMNPDVFIQGVVNGAHGAPFFISRFRDALFHFSTLFDMLETNVARETPERMLIEKEIFGREAMNAIACEGLERIERPETYKQWQVRNLRAGFRQLPLNREIMTKAKEWVKSCYHKDFVIDEDGQWMLQGWKGRITYAISSWRPAF